MFRRVAIMIYTGMEEIKCSQTRQSKRMISYQEYTVGVSDRKSITVKQKYNAGSSLN